MKKQILNPYLPCYEYIPDGEPHVFGERLYVFGSHDSFGGTHYCQNDYVCYSAPLSDLSDWKFEGVIFKKADEPRNKEGKMSLFAPDVCQGSDGRYYLYYVADTQPVVSVAVCDTPAGKYEFLGYVKYKNGTLLGEKTGDIPQFDPAVLFENGRVYLYTGFCHPEDESSKGSQITVLEDDMRTVCEEPKRSFPQRQREKKQALQDMSFLRLPQYAELVINITSSIPQSFSMNCAMQSQKAPQRVSFTAAP